MRALYFLLLVLLISTEALAQTTPTFQVKTIPDLVLTNIPVIKNRLTALVTGRVSANDGAGGLFFYDDTSTAATNLGTVFKPSGVAAGAAGRWLRQYTGAINARWFGAVGDDSNNDATALQAAITFCQANSTALYIPGGTYRINTGLTIAANNNSVRIYGDSARRTILKAAVAQTAMLTLGDATAQTEYVVISDIVFDGNSAADYGVSGTRVDHSRLDNCYIRGTSIAAINIGYGWDNEILECELTGNSGDGIIFNRTFDIANNAVNVINTKIYLNSGHGIHVFGAKMLRVEGCTIESNLKSGIFARGPWKGGGIINNYFEGNGTTGVAFTTPAVTVKADIILNGNSGTDFDSADPPGQLAIENNSTSSAGVDAFIKLISVDSATLANTARGSVGPTTLVSAVAQYGHPRNLVMSGNDSAFTTLLDVTDIADSRSVLFSSWQVKEMQARNYFSDSVFAWSALTAGGTLKRGDSFFNGFSSMAITNVVGNSGVFGMSIVVTNYPELTNRPVYFGAWVRASTTSVGGAIYANGLANTTSVSSGSTNWTWFEMAVEMPSSGSVEFGVRKLAGAATDVLYIANPILTLVGNNKERFYREIRKPAWAASAAPTAGSWQAGDYITNSIPTTPGVMGFFCSASGEPGTWNNVISTTSSGTYLSPANNSSTISVDNVIGAFNAFSNDASTTSSGGVGHIRISAQQNYTTGNTPSYMSFYTHPDSVNDGSILGLATEKWRINAGGDFISQVLGTKFRYPEGANASMGTAVLNGASPSTVTVATTAVTANTRIFLTINTPGAAPGAVWVSARVAATSFTITGANTDTSTVAWIFFEPSP